FCLVFLSHCQSLNLFVVSARTFCVSHILLFPSIVWPIPPYMLCVCLSLCVCVCVYVCTCVCATPRTFVFLTYCCSPVLFGEYHHICSVCVSLSVCVCVCMCVCVC